MKQRQRHRTGSGGPGFMVVGLVLLGLLGWMLYAMGRSPSSHTGSADGAAGPGNPSLMLYCAAVLRVPIERIVAAYEQEFGVEVATQFGGSNTLLSQIEVGRTGDLFLAADNSYAELAQRKGLLRETLPLASIRAVIAVNEKNPKRILGFADLLRDDVRVAIGNPDQAAIGSVVRKTLAAIGKWEPLEAAITARGVFQPTVTEVANAVNVGAADAGIVWNATIAHIPDLSAIEPPEFADATGQVALGVLKCSRQPAEALRFARFVAACDRGLIEFEKAGFQTIAGDPFRQQGEAPTSKAATRE